MPTSLDQVIVQAAASNGVAGRPMGQVVEACEQAGFSVEDAELRVWKLLGDGNLLAVGFVARSLRRRDPEGKPYRQRVYELVLATTSPQLELGLGESK